MIRRIRDKLAEIEYHSATRRTNFWTRAAGVAMLLAFVLAIPAMWVADELIVREFVHATLQGHVLRVDGEYDAYLQKDEQWVYDYGAGVEVLGGFTMVAVDERRGWPVQSSVRRKPVQGMIDLYGEPQPMNDVVLDDSDPMQAAILAELRENAPANVRDWLEGPSNSAERRWQPTAAVMGAVVWLVVLVFGLRLLLIPARLGAILLSGRRSARRVERIRSGLCQSCGYDLQGLDFHARCPECGTLVGV